MGCTGCGDLPVYKMVEEVVILGFMCRRTHVLGGGNAQAVHARAACAWAWVRLSLSLGHALRHAPGPEWWHLEGGTVGLTSVHPHPL